LTEGQISILSAAHAFLYNLATYITVPYGGVFSSELIGAGALLCLAAYGLATSTKANKKLLRPILAFLLGYATLVFLIDKITNHHTIAVSRYSLAIIPSLIIGLAAGLLQYRSIGIALIIFYRALSLNASISMMNGGRAPKQMLREAASYISGSAHASDPVVISPSGPTLLGYAYYAPASSQVAATPSENLKRVINETAEREGGGGLSARD